MITADGWFDFAERVPGDPSKVNGWLSPAAGFVAHSAEGYEAYLRSYNVNQAANATRRASWHLSNLYDGRLLQHFPVQAQCWASGAPFPNNNYVAMEHEGLVGEVLTPAQTATTARVIGELAQLKGWTPARGATLWEHQECRRWGAEPTACPSGRIPWDAVLAAIGGNDPMDEVRESALDRRNALVALLAALTGEGAVIQVAPEDETYRAVILSGPDGTVYGRVPIANLPSYFENAPWL